MAEPSTADVRAARAATMLMTVALYLSSPQAIAGEPVPCQVLDPELQASYVGGCANGMAEGSGVAEGVARYEGEFKAGRKHGKGTKVWPTGDRYEGQFVDDRKEGTGVYSWGAGTPWAGEKYTGQYRHDRREGSGVYAWPDGERYSGSWKEDTVLGLASTRMLGRVHDERERLAAVSRPGLTVCRRMRVGSVVQDWVRATVVTVHSQQITVRIDEPGQFEHRIQGMEVKKGVAIRDWALMWTPCKP